MRRVQARHQAQQQGRARAGAEGCQAGFDPLAAQHRRLPQQRRPEAQRPVRQGQGARLVEKRRQRAGQGGAGRVGIAALAEQQYEGAAFDTAQEGLQRGRGRNGGHKAV